MIYTVTPEQHDEQVEDMIKWIKDNTKYTDEWSVDIWNTLNDLRQTIEHAKMLIKKGE